MCSAKLGPVVPMPTLPAESIVTLGDMPVLKTILPTVPEVTVCVFKYSVPELPEVVPPEPVVILMLPPLIVVVPVPPLPASRLIAPPAPLGDVPLPALPALMVMAPPAIEFDTPPLPPLPAVIVMAPP